MPGFDKERLIGKQVHSALSKAIDSETRINIVDPGLAYDANMNNEQIDLTITPDYSSLPCG